MNILLLNPLYFVVFISFVCGAGFMLLTRGITFFAVGTDNQKQVIAAAQANKWRWPSDMHKFSSGKTYMKDVAVLWLVLMQRILRDKKTDYPLVSMCALANALSGIFIYVIALRYWGMGVALPLFIMYITSFWPWQIALMGGHICVAQFFFLLSILFFQLADASSAGMMIFWITVAGAAFGFMQFSSASARKYTPLFLGAFLFSQRDYFLMGKIAAIIPVAAVSGGAFLLLMLIVKLLYKPVISAIYRAQAPFGLNGLIKNREMHDLGYYISKGNESLRGLEKTAFLLFVYFVAYIGSLGWRSFYLAQIPVILGTVFAFLVLLLPNIASNLKGYLSYFNIARAAGHFRLYEKYFAEIGKPIKKDMRGAGLEWVIKYFCKVAPFQSLIYIFCLIAILIFGITDEGKLITGAVMILLSMSPVLWGEITRGPQVGRSYLPGLLGMLVLIGFTLATFNRIDILYPLLLLNTAWNLYIFFFDVYPARMAPAWLTRDIKKGKIKKIYTYDTGYNDAFVNTVNEEDKKDIDIIRINSLNEVKDDNGIIVVPGTSSKALNMESAKEGYLNKDFSSDLALYEILDSREIEKMAIRRYKTLGTSRIWGQESEVLSYRDLILKEVKEEDRWRGYAWMLSAGKVKGVFS